MKMVIYFRDDGGIVELRLDTERIDFLDGCAYCDSNGKDYRIRVDCILAIENK